MKPRKHAELIKAWADGATIQFKNLSGEWVDCPESIWGESCEYRIKPEPKPDVDVKEHIQLHHFENSPYATVVGDRAKFPNVKFTFDGETGELKSAEALK